MLQILRELKRINQLLFPLKSSEKLTVLWWWFLGEQKLINLLQFASYWKHGPLMSGKLHVSKVKWTMKTKILYYDKTKILYYALIVSTCYMQWNHFDQYNSVKIWQYANKLNSQIENHCFLEIQIRLLLKTQFQNSVPLKLTFWFHSLAAKLTKLPTFLRMCNLNYLIISSCNITFQILKLLRFITKYVRVKITFVIGVTCVASCRINGVIEPYSQINGPTTKC